MVTYGKNKFEKMAIFFYYYYYFGGGVGKRGDNTQQNEWTNATVGWEVL